MEDSDLERSLKRAARAAARAAKRTGRRTASAARSAVRVAAPHVAAAASAAQLAAEQASRAVLAQAAGTASVASTLAGRAAAHAGRASLTFLLQLDPLTLGVVAAALGLLRLAGRRRVHQRSEAPVTAGERPRNTSESPASPADALLPQTTEQHLSLALQHHLSRLPASETVVLALSLPWMDAVLRSSGLPSLLAQLDAAVQAEPACSPVLAALRRAAPGLHSHAGAALAAQLLARLSSHPAASSVPLGQLLKQADESLRTPPGTALRLLSPSLDQPGAALEMVLEPAAADRATVNDA